MSVTEAEAIEAEAKAAEEASLQAKKLWKKSIEQIKEKEYELSIERMGRGIREKIKSTFSGHQQEKDILSELEKLDELESRYRKEYIVASTHAKQLRQLANAYPENKLKSLKTLLAEKENDLAEELQKKQQAQQEFSGAMKTVNTLEVDYRTEAEKWGPIKRMMLYEMQEKPSREKIKSTQVKILQLNKAADEQEIALQKLEGNIAHLRSIIQGSKTPSAIDIQNRQKIITEAKALTNEEAVKAQNVIMTLIANKQQEIEVAENQIKALEARFEVINTPFKQKVEAFKKAQNLYQSYIDAGPLWDKDPIPEPVPLQIPPELDFLEYAIRAREVQLSQAKTETREMEDMLKQIEKRHQLQAIEPPLINKTQITTKEILHNNNEYTQYLQAVSARKASREAKQNEPLQYDRAQMMLGTLQRTLEFYNDKEIKNKFNKNKKNQTLTMSLEELEATQDKLNTTHSSLYKTIQEKIDINDYTDQDIEELGKEISALEEKLKEAEKRNLEQITARDTAKLKFDIAEKEASLFREKRDAKIIKTPLTLASKKILQQEDIAYIDLWFNTAKLRVIEAENQQLALILGRKKTVITALQLEEKARTATLAMITAAKAPFKELHVATDLKLTLESLQTAENKFTETASSVQVEEIMEQEGEVNISTAEEREKAKIELQKSLLEARLLKDSIEKMDRQTAKLETQDMHAAAQTIWADAMPEALMKSQVAYYNAQQAEHDIASITKEIDLIKKEIRILNPQTPREIYEHASKEHELKLATLLPEQAKLTQLQQEKIKIENKIASIQKDIETRSEQADKAQYEEAALTAAKNTAEALQTINKVKQILTEPGSRVAFDNFKQIFPVLINPEENSEKTKLINELNAIKPKKSNIKLGPKEQYEQTKRTEQALDAAFKAIDILQKSQEAGKSIATDFKAHQLTVLQTQLADMNAQHQAITDRITKAQKSVNALVAEENTAKIKMEAAANELRKREVAAAERKAAYDAAKTADQEALYGKEAIVNTFSDNLAQWQKKLQDSINKLEHKHLKPAEREKLKVYTEAKIYLEAIMKELSIDSLEESITAMQKITEDLKQINTSSNWKKIQAKGIELFKGAKAVEVGGYLHNKQYLYAQKLHKQLQTEWDELHQNKSTTKILTEEAPEDETTPLIQPTKKPK